MDSLVQGPDGDRPGAPRRCLVFPVLTIDVRDGHLITICAAAIALSACSDGVRGTGFDVSRFTASPGLMVCFDLDVAGRPVAGLSIDTPPPAAVERHTVVLPFGVTSVDNNRAMFTTWSSYDAYSIIDYSRYPGVAQTASVGFVPVFEPTAETDFTVEKLSGTLHLAVSGLKRRFFLRLQEDRAGRANAAPAVQTISAIALRLPRSAEIFERRSTAAQPTQEADVRGSVVRVYSGGEMSPVDVVYQVPPSDLQNAIFDYGLKFFGVLIVPLIELAALTSSKVRNARARKIALAVGGAIELCVIAGLLWWAFYIRGVSGLNALLDVGIAIVGAATSVGLAMIKVEK